MLNPCPDNRVTALHSQFGHCLLAALPLLIAGAAQAGLTFNTVRAPGGFIQAGAAPSSNSSSYWPGGDATPFFAEPGGEIEEQAFAGNGSASASAASSAPATNNGSSGTVGLGYVQLNADNNAPNNSSGAMAEGNAGWSDMITVSSPGLTGQTGYMQYTVNVSGTLAGTGFAGSASLLVIGYKDTSALMWNSFFDYGDSDLISTDLQYGHWAVSTFGAPDSQTVNDTVTFAVPITFGTPFKLGVYAKAHAGMRSSSGVPGNSTATVDFSDGLTWGGVVNVYHGNTPIGNYTVTSASGVDWTQAGGPPSPADLNQDGTVNAADLTILLSSWGTPNADLNGDGTTNAADLTILLSAWS